MDLIETITQFISTLGFPIAVVCYLFYYQTKVLDTFRGSISANTKVLQELVLEIQHHYHSDDDKAA
jgi:hypothetical protein